MRINQIILLKGFFENTLSNLKNEKFKLVYLDCCSYQSYKTCLEFLYERVLPDGYIVFDDYNHPRSIFPGVQKAVDDFFRDKPEKIICFEETKLKKYFIKKL